MSEEIRPFYKKYIENQYALWDSLPSSNIILVAPFAGKLGKEEGVAIYLPFQWEKYKIDLLSPLNLPY